MNERFVRRALAANAVFSLCTGVSLMLFASSLGPRLGVDPAWALQALGGALVPFGLGVAFVAKQKPLRASWVAAISLMDAGWVIGTLILALFWPGVMNQVGWTVAVVVALFVDAFCIAQLVGLRRLTANPNAENGEGRSVLRAERIVPVPIARAWEVISDVGGYAEYAPNIGFSKVLSGEGASIVRECGDGSGRWTEKASVWTEGKAYGFRVQTDAPDYPYPFKVLGGLWELEPADGGTRVRMRFDVSMKGGLLGDALLAAALVPKFNSTLETLLDNWERAMIDA